MRAYVRSAKLRKANERPAVGGTHQSKARTVCGPCASTKHSDRLASLMTEEI
jgi:hypothetical protein